MSTHPTYDTVVVGAGVFGAWTALHLAKQKQRVLLVEAHAPAHSRSSSGGESRIIRMSYGADEIYTRWSLNSLKQWKQLFGGTGHNLFYRTGVLWLSGENTSTLDKSAVVLRRHGIIHEILQREELLHRYPQINVDDVPKALLEPESGVLLARRAVASVVESARLHGVHLQIANIETPVIGASLQSIKTSLGQAISAGGFVFACGAWLNKLFPEILGSRIFPTRQEVFFFGPPSGGTQFSAPALPTWLFQSEEVYGMPDLEGRGLKVACDTHGELVDPDTQSRLVSPEGIEFARNFLARRFPALKDAPITETRVCQYENTSNGDFLIDRHPYIANVWFAGGGSGHGFKHGPAVGEYVASLVLGQGASEHRFSLATKETKRTRTVH